MRLEATNKNVRGGLNKPPPSQGGLNVKQMIKGQDVGIRDKR